MGTSAPKFGLKLRVKISTPENPRATLSSKQPNPNGTAIWRHRFDGGTCGQARPWPHGAQKPNHHHFIHSQLPHTTPTHRSGGWDKTRSQLCQQLSKHTQAASTQLAKLTAAARPNIITYFFRIIGLR